MAPPDVLAALLSPARVLVFILQSTAPGDINDGLMELLIMIHAVGNLCCGPAEEARLTRSPVSPSAGLLARDESRPSYPTFHTHDRIRKVGQAACARLRLAGMLTGF